MEAFFYRLIYLFINYFIEIFSHLIANDRFSYSYLNALIGFNEAAFIAG